MPYADLILPLALQSAYTYEIPPSMVGQVSRGCRALVQFGKKKFYAGLVMRVHDEKPAYETKTLSEVVDVRPMVRESQIALWQWIADYYICSMGEVLKAAMPSGLKLESETKVTYNNLFDGDVDALTPRQRQVLDFVREKKTCTITEVGAALDGVNPISHVKALIDAEALFVSEEMKDAYRPKTVTTFSLMRDYRSEDALFALFDELEKRAPRQAESLMAFLQVCGGTGKATSGVRMERDKLSADKRISLPAMAELAKKGILCMEKVAVSRLQDYDSGIVPPRDLTPAQSAALEKIVADGASGRPVLLHGVTGSGKTEVYIHLISRCLDSGRSALYLLPEIALTTQITERLRRHFGDRMLVYHSKFSDAERVEVWGRLLGATEPVLVLGVRSSVLLPLPDLGLVVVDEEHESSYKQYDPAPRYNARDMAVLLAMQSLARNPEAPKTLAVLGSATPSLETWLNAQAGKYALVSLTERHSGVQLPEVEAIDMTEARKHKEVQSMFSFRLKKVIEDALNRKEQVILFQNRRGFAPVVECHQCAWVPKCQNCDVSLTYHKASNMLVCHYCGFSAALPTTCPACGTPSLRPQGFGTEKIEEECKALFPTARVARMDLDTARSRKAFEQIISDFAARQQDILIGTQMVSKGLDFEGVTTVGILSADSMLNMPDFRADERSFQLMAQVSGRAGRRGSRGHVYVQVSKADHPVVRDVAAQDFESSARRLLSERQAYRFPPFFRLISLTVKHKDLFVCTDAARVLAGNLQSRFGQMVAGPVAPLVSRVSTFYLQEITLKMPRTTQPAAVKAQMMECVNALLAEQQFHAAQVRIDVDPY